MERQQTGWSSLAQKMAGKSDPEQSGYWLSLWMHALDTAGVFQRLVQNWIPQSVREEIKLSEEELVQVARYLGVIHDVGKSILAFQAHILRGLPEARERLCAALPLTESFLHAGKSPHARASEAILLALGCREGVAAVAGAHHGKPQESSIGDRIKDQLETYRWNYYGEGQKAQWQGVWEEFHARALAESGLTSAAELPTLTAPQEVLLTGLLIMADWIASNVAFFPLIPESDLGEEDAYPERVDRAWRALGLTSPWESACAGMEDSVFRARFGFAPNAVQRAVIDCAREASAAGIWILEAQMGVGKTEAALAAAEIFAERFQAGGLFFGLPTQATANGLFDRLLAWGNAQSQDMAHSIRLAHGAASLNEAYAQFLAGRAITQEEDPEEGLWVHRWFQGSKQALLADFVVGTVDQLLMAALRQKHVMLRHLGLAGKVVVVDECHAYDAYMNGYLDRALEWLGRYRVPVILLSATLPARRREALIRAYLGKRAQPGAWSRSRGYPLLTWTDGDQVFQKTIPQGERERRVAFLRVNESGLPKFLQEKLQGGGCAGVIVNTVRKAQRIAAFLRRTMPGFQVQLIHAQFLMPDRAEKEEELRRNLGKNSTAAQRDRRILVGTQVLEQSLDIDFDLLVTDLCPMDLLLQRIGRLQRHLRQDRPAGLETAVCAVLDEGDGAYDPGSLAIYGEWLLWRTRELLPEQICLPADIPRLVQDVYGWAEGDCLPEGAAQEAAREAYEIAEKRREENAKSYAVSKPWKRERDYHNWLTTSAALSDAAARAAVRDGDPALDVLVMMCGEDDSVRFLPWQEGGAQVATDRPPSWEESRRIARQQLRLPGYFSKRWNLDRAIRELEEDNRERLAEWQRAPLLKGELVLLLNASLEAKLAGARLRYDREEGLVYQRGGDE